MIHQIAETAVSSLLKEVFTTPKPGLVDVLSSGAHKDMSLLTFLKSAAALSPFFYNTARTAAAWQGSLPELFTEIRKLGIQGENQMFAATGGVNTHKGLIFSEGILTASAAYTWKHRGTIIPDTVFSTASKMTYSAIENDFSSINKAQPATHGEKLFVQYGCKGIRGEAQCGFPAVRYIALPALTRFMKAGIDENLARVQTLFILMSKVNDTNILYRCGPQTLHYVKETASHALSLGGAFTRTGLEYIFSLDSIFISKNISAGGCADLLAVAIMMYDLEQLSAPAVSPDNSVGDTAAAELISADSLQSYR